MWQTIIPIIALLLSVFCLGSCSDRASVNSLRHAEQIMEEHPDSALMLIQGVDATRLCTDRHRALYALLRTQALVKNDSVIPSDSLIRTAVDYYTRHPKAPYLMKSAFYLAEVQRNMGNLTSAIKSATQAYDLAREADDPYWIAKSAEQLMFIYTDAFNREESQKYAYVAAENYKKSGHHLNHLYSLCDICVDDKNSGRYQIALNRIDSVLNIVSDDSHTPLISYCHIVRFPICIEIGNYEEARKSLQELKKQSLAFPIPPRIIGYEAELYRKLGDIERAECLLDSLGKLVGSVRDKGIMYNEYYNLYKEVGKYPEALKYKDSLMNLQNEEVVKLVSSDVALAQKDYYDQNYRVEEKKSRNYRNTIIEIVIISLIVIFSIIYAYRIIVKRKNEKIENKIKDILILSSQLKENETERLRILGVLTDKEKESTTLYKDQWTTLNMLCHEYFEKGDSETMRATILKNIESRIKELNSPKSIKSLEESVNKYMQDIIARLRNKNDLFKFNDADIKFMTLCCAGFAPRAICLLIDITLNNYYTKKRRLVERIQRHSEELSEEIKRYL